MTTNDEQLIKLLAVAVVDNPRSTLKELAESVGISKATLHRFCGTRDKLEILLKQKSYASMQYVVEVAEKDYTDYVDGVKSLIDAHFRSKEYLRYSCSFINCSEDEHWLRYAKAIDSFFLRAQKQGVIRIDLSVPTLTDLLLSVIYGVFDSERRGRIASNYMIETVETSFLHGVLNK